MAQYISTKTPVLSCPSPPSIPFFQENVYLLLAKLQTLLISSSSGSPGQLSALFISNKIKTCPVWGQLAAGEDGSKNVERKDEREYKETGHKEHFDGDDNDDNEERERSPVLWDYHGELVMQWSRKMKKGAQQATFFANYIVENFSRHLENSDRLPPCFPPSSSCRPLGDRR